MWIVIILVFLFFLLVYYKFYLPLQYWRDRQIPHLTPSLIIGNLGPVIRRKETFNAYLQKICGKFKNFRYFGFYQFSQPCLILLDRELIKQIFVKHFENFTDHYDVLPKDIDTFWKRGFPAFTSKKMKAMFQLVTECSERFVDYFVKQNTIIALDIMDAFTKFNNDVIASCTFGIHCDSLINENNEFYRMGKEAFDFSGLKSIKFFGNAFSPTLSRLFRVKMFSTRISNFFLRITKETISYRKQTGLYRPDVMHLLIEAQKGRLTYDDDDLVVSGYSGIDDFYPIKPNFSNKTPITDEDIASQAFVFFFGSYDTMSSALSHTVYELVANMDVQVKLRTEINYTLNQCNGKITYESIFKMKYLDMVISESLRLWPPPAILNRVCVKPFVIEPILPNEKSLLVEPGTEIIIPVYASHRNPKYFTNPDKFDPDRFSDENKDTIKSFTYFPFGIGPRFCIGNRFALMTMKIIIYKLLAHFEIIPVKQTVIPLEQSKNTIMLRSKHGYWFGLKPIQDKL
ncbi:hypothetical protein RN001_002253 [Aquatica leii]|uniref:Cytochrome P450 n=1 Tax=Aquatica leii TaxID=1421715 RepID=A0AAN7Q8I1_9COLE|nr:hypothetical protein RN001_002253 [Aquatica leii]